MVREKGEERLTLMEAVDQLSSMSEIDIQGRVEEEPLEMEKVGIIDWTNPRQALQNIDLINETFVTIHRYLQSLTENEKVRLKNPEMQKGIQAIMLIVEEAVKKMDRYAALYDEKHKPLSSLEEYKNLKKFYKQQIQKYFPKKREEKEEWEEKEEQVREIEIQKKGLKGIEAIRNDKNYELLFIRDENGKPYFSPGLLRHIRLVGNFDELVATVEGEDPLLKMRTVQEHMLHHGATYILKNIAPYLDDFFKQAMKHKNLQFIKALNKTIMALQMAANPKNLIENQSYKSCLEYFGDFHRFLRLALVARGYKNRISNPPEDLYSLELLTLTHGLCCFFFMREEPIDEAVHLIEDLARRGEELREPYKKPKASDKRLQVWEDLKDKDENIRHLLKHFPNGPLMKTLDSLREHEPEEGFDPLMHQNFPCSLFTFSKGDFHVSVLRIPNPTKQTDIKTCEIVEEFKGFLRFYKHELKENKHLLINLQDRSAWQEFSRAKILENFSKHAEFSSVLNTVTIPKNTDFYFQSDEYESIGGADVFLEQLKEQVLGEQECGYFFPKSLQIDECFIDHSIKLLHNHFFEQKPHFFIQERRSFIDLFTLLIILKLIEISKCDSISFTCKDALDAGAAQSALAYGFLSLLAGDSLFVERLQWMLYSSVLEIRERPLEKMMFHRAMNTLEMIHTSLLESRKQILKELNDLYDTLTFPVNIS